MSLDEQIDALFALPLEEFVPARDALAKQLRADKRRDDAEAVKALRKPNVAAFTLNQLARNHADEIEELLDAGGALGTAQQEALAGGGAAALRRASVRRDNALRGLLEIAPSADVQSLRAASTDPALADQLRAGRLSRELEPTDVFGGLSAAVPDDELAARRRQKADATPPRDTNDLEAELAERTAQLEAQRATEAVRAAETLRAAEAERKAAAERQKRIEAAQGALADATAVVERLERELEEARHAVRRATDELERQRG